MTTFFEGGRRKLKISLKTIAMSALLKAYRKHEGIGQEELGRRMDLSGSYISKLESGQRTM
ncbi:MAG: XRE family transcriptional regulator, partial [Sphingobacteriales bacterium]